MKIEIFDFINRPLKEEKRILFCCSTTHIHNMFATKVRRLTNHFMKKRHSTPSLSQNLIKSPSKDSKIHVQRFDRTEGTTRSTHSGEKDFSSESCQGTRTQEFGRSHSKPSFGWCSWCQVYGLGNLTFGSRGGSFSSSSSLAESFDITTHTQQGIRFRGRTIPDLQKELPPTVEGGEPTPEGLCGFFSPETFPRKLKCDSLTEELHSRAKLPSHVENMIRSFPEGMHPMTQLSSAVLALQTDSVFAEAYRNGTPKSMYWEHTLEDLLTLTARLPEVAALIYRCTFKDSKVASYDSSLDYSANCVSNVGIRQCGI